MKVNISSSSLEVKTGDILSESSDALVIPANDGLWMGSGLNGVIKKKGGIEIEQQAVAAGPATLGQVVSTIPGDLKYKNIIHAVIKGQDLKVIDSAVTESLKNALITAVNNGLRNIIFSDFLDELRGISQYECIKILLNETINFLIESEETLNIVFVFSNEENYIVSKNELQKIFSAG